MYAWGMPTRVEKKTENAPRAVAAGPGCSSSLKHITAAPAYPSPELPFASAIAPEPKDRAAGCDEIRGNGDAGGTIDDRIVREA